MREPSSLVDVCGVVVVWLDVVVRPVWSVIVVETVVVVEEGVLVVVVSTTVVMGVRPAVGLMVVVVVLVEVWPSAVLLLVVVVVVCVELWFGASLSGVVFVVVVGGGCGGGGVDGVNQTPPFVFIHGNKLEVVEGGVRGGVHEEVAKFTNHPLLFDRLIYQSALSLSQDMPKPS